jgi:peroxiredoxin Q/BCP
MKGKIHQLTSLNSSIKLLIMKLKIGDTAPEINSLDQNGNPITLSQFSGKKKVILYFYPKDDTPGCTKEACNFRDNYALLKKKGFEVLGVSIDDAKKHTKFIEKYELPFSLIADTEKKVVEDYGVWGKKKFMGREYMGTNRVTFIIDKNGIIENIIEKVDTENSTAQILE